MMQGRVQQLSVQKQIRTTPDPWAKSLYMLIDKWFPWELITAWGMLQTVCKNI